VFSARGLDRIAVEDPGSFGARSLLQSWGVATPPVPVDDRGLQVDRLAATGARAVLLTPAHQFPTGVVMDGDRRRDLMAWAAGGGLVFEDDYDAEHRYDRPPVPALRSLDPHQVVYAGSVSKLLAPALRIGWLIPPEPWRERFLLAKRATDLGTSALPQLVLARLMESGELERQLRLVRRRHRQRRDAMLAALATHIPVAVVHGAAAGLHLTITLPDGVDDTAVAREAMARGVKVHPLSWHAQRPFLPGLVLGYAATTPSAIADGVRTVGQVVAGRRKSNR
jgi:GntR family transcriptional regulator/MocR family aminotransferase